MPAKVGTQVRKPAPLREILEMRMQGMTMQAIGDHFGVSNVAISKRISGAMKLLDGDRLDAYRKNRISILECIEEKLLSELVNPERVKKATLGNVAYAFSQIHNARRLESGESTANLSLAAVVAMAKEARLNPKKQTATESANASI